MQSSQPIIITQEASSPPRLFSVHWMLLPSARGEVGLQLGQAPNPLLQLHKVAVAAQDFGVHQVEHLQSVSQHKVNPCQPSAKVFLLPQEAAELLELAIGAFGKGFQRVFPRVVGVGSVSEFGEIGDEILVDSEDGCECHLLLGISSEQVLPVGFVAGVDDDGRALGDDLLAINQVGQVGSRILLEVLGLVLLEPLVLVVLVVEHLLVLEPSVLKDQSDPLGQPANRPVSQHQLFRIIHQDMLRSIILSQIHSNQRFCGPLFLASSETSSLLRVSQSHSSFSTMTFFLKEQQGAC